ncbi:MAG: hypothetical protein IPH24_00230 [Crocinitomicaceae bacterium]|nr:hypothetical protein [Crocinitomicaceae bacterium]
MVTFIPAGIVRVPYTCTSLKPEVLKGFRLGVHVWLAPPVQLVVAV